MKASLLGALGLGLLQMGSSTGSPLYPGPTLYYFLSRESPGGGELAGRVVRFVRENKRSLRLRPVLLVEDFASLGKLGTKSTFLETLKALGPNGRGGLDIPIYDEEGLRLARSWRITHLPALVLVRGRHVHVAMGDRGDPKDLERCKR